MERPNVAHAARALIAERGEFSSGDLARRLGISRQAAHLHLTGLVRAKKLERIGAGRGTRYRLPRVALVALANPRAGLAEDVVWRDVAEVALLRQLRPNVTSMLRFAFTEMVNNAIEHSRGSTVWVDVIDAGKAIAFEVRDDGVGIFAHVMETRGLRTPFEAIAELQKGKVTTMPETHTGQGIFFTSKLADRMTIESETTRWVIDNVREDQGAEIAPLRKGTRVHFEVAKDSKRTTEETFARYTDERFEFSKTRAVIKLFREGNEIVSRSEARRLLAGLEKFREVALDFKEVRGIGQGFADEVFRVWQRDHPGTRLVAVNANAAVKFMIDRARTGAAEIPAPTPVMETPTGASVPTYNISVGRSTKTSSG